MDAKTIEYAKRNPELDFAFQVLVRLHAEAKSRDGRGETGIRLIFKGSEKPVMIREVTDLVHTT